MKLLTIEIRSVETASGENIVFSKNYTATIVNISAVNDDFGKKKSQKNSLKLHSKYHSISCVKHRDLIYISFVRQKR